MIDDQATSAMSDHELVSKYREKLAETAVWERKNMVNATELRNLIDEILERQLTNEEINTLHKQ